MKSQGTSKAGEKEIWAIAEDIENKREVVHPPRTVCYYHIVKEAIQQAIAQERERIVIIVHDLIKNSENRTSEVECQQEGYEIGLEDLLHIITNNHEDHKE